MSSDKLDWQDNNMVEAGRRELYIPGQEALSSLHRLIEESVRETQDLQTQLDGCKHGTDLLNWHKRTERFNYVYRDTQRAKRDIHKPREINGLHQKFAGQVFQDITYSVCALGCDDSRVVFSPEKTSEFWTILYPNKKIISHPYGQEALKNVYVPDGILVDKSKSFIFKVYEYSLVQAHKIDEKFERQLKSIRIQQKRFPGLFAQASVGFVIPRTFPLPELKGEREEIEFLQLPITRVQFGHFIRDLYNGMR